MRGAQGVLDFAVPVPAECGGSQRNDEPKLEPTLPRVLQRRTGTVALLRPPYLLGFVGFYINVTPFQNLNNTMLTDIIHGNIT